MKVLLLVAFTSVAITSSYKLRTPTNALWYFQLFVSEEFIENNVFFYLYTRENVYVPQQLYVNNQVALRNSYFDPRKKTVILIHGYEVDYKGTSVQDPKNKYLEWFDFNVIALDYGDINGSSILKYLQVVSYTYKIGQFLGKFIYFLIDQGVDPNNVHVIGHSLGAHIAGFAGKFTKSDHQISLGRITGLAPSYPGYEDNTSQFRLSSDDAKFTDCIFTDYNNLDMGIPICQANFFPNGVGISQPGCFREDIMGSCSHSRGVDLFVESIDPQSSFKVQICAEVPWITKTNYCWLTNETYMGQYANPKLAGLFYLKTNGEYPFSQG
uniref:Lipase member H-A n=1 Tax=Lygus hesperus TaxID=30085 RepID=A0A146LY41_LYGHE